MATTAADILIDTIHDWDVDFVVDPFEPPMPAKVTLEQAAKLAESLRAWRAESRSPCFATRSRNYFERATKPAVLENSATGKAVCRF